MEKPVEGEEEGSSMGTRLDAFVVDWDDDAVGKVMSYVRDWNTNAKHVMVAQVSLRFPSDSCHKILRPASFKTCRSSDPPLLSLSPDVVLQTLLNCLFRLIPFDRLKRCCASKPAILDGLLSYTDRHLNRADRILQVTNNPRVRET